jgi:hypothetical protein
MYYDSNVYSGMLEWVESGGQKRKYKDVLPRPVTEDLLLVKLRPGQVSRAHIKQGVADWVRWLISIALLRRVSGRIMRNIPLSVSPSNLLDTLIADCMFSYRLVPPTPAYHPAWAHSPPTSTEISEMLSRGRHSHRRGPRWRTPSDSEKSPKGHSLERSA